MDPSLELHDKAIKAPDFFFVNGLEGVHNDERKDEEEDNEDNENNKGDGKQRDGR